MRPIGAQSSVQWCTSCEIRIGMSFAAGCTGSYELCTWSGRLCRWRWVSLKEKKRNQGFVVRTFDAKYRYKRKAQDLHSNLADLILEFSTPSTLALILRMKGWEHLSFVASAPAGFLPSPSFSTLSPLRPVDNYRRIMTCSNPGGCDDE
jgi:hypothetical protein